MWNWSKKDRGARPDSPAAGLPIGDEKRLALSDEKKRPREEWRVVLRDSAGAGVHLSWHDGGIQAARVALETQVRDHSETTRDRPPDATDAAATDALAPTADESKVDAFLGRVVLIKFEKLYASASDRGGGGGALESLPLNAQALTSLKVLRLAGDGLVSDAVMFQLLRHPPALREVDLGGQRLDATRLVTLFASTPCAPPPAPPPAASSSFPAPSPSPPARLGVLASLRLRNNAIERLPPQVLLEMPMLTLLDLSDNALTEAPEALFSLCPHLVSLNLEVLSLLALPVQKYKH